MNTKQGYDYADRVEGREATGEIEEELEPERDTEAKREAGRKGGKARAESLTPEQRAEIAKKGAAARWREENNTIAA